MIRRSSKILLEVVIGFLAGLALVAGMALWRLSTGPVALDFITPYLEDVFRQTRSGIRVDVGETVLSWEGWSRTVDLRARDVTVQDAEGATVAVFPDVSVNLSLRALLKGTVAPTVIEIIGARVSLKRGPEGRFRLAAEQPSRPLRPVPGEGELTGVVPALVDLFLREPDPESPLGYLTAVRILEGQMIVEDEQLDTVWVAPVANMELRRHDAGLAAFLELELALGEGMVDANLEVLYDHVRGRIDVAARVAGLRPKELGSVVPALAALKAVNLPLEASAAAVFDANGAFQSLRFDVTGGAGEVTLPDMLFEPWPLAGLEVRGTLDGATRRLELQKLELRFGSGDAPGPTVSASATVDDLDGGLEIAGELRLDALSAGDLEHYWPLILADGARKWVTKRVLAGTARDLVLDLSASVPGGDFSAIEIARLEGGFDFQDATVAYYLDLPPMTDIHGRATIDGKSLHFRVAGGRVGEIALAGGQVDILLGDWARRRTEVAGDVAGPLPVVLDILDHQSLRLLEKIDIAPIDAIGDVEAHLSFTIPLKKGITLNDVELGVDARIEQASVASFLLGQDGSEMDMAIQADRLGMVVAGTLNLTGIPARMDWREDFSREAPQRTLLKLDFPSLETIDRRALGFDLAPYLEGPVSASIIAKVLHDRGGKVKIAANLASAHISLPFLNWEKPPGVAGQARVTLSLVDAKVDAIEHFDIEAGTLLARGRSSLTPDGRNFQELHFEQLSFHGTTLYNPSVARDGPGFTIALGEGVVDLDSFFEDEEPPPESEEPAIMPDEEPETPVRINGRKLDSLYFGEGRYLQGVELDMERSSLGWERVSLRGEVPPVLWARGENGTVPDEAGSQPKVVTLEFGPSGMGDYRLTINMNDMGAALRALDVIDTVEGGNLVITGVTKGPIPRHPIKGRIEAQDYRVVKAPVLAQLLSLASLSGVGRVLSGEGLEFKRLVGKFKLKDGVATTDLIRAYGGGLGLTARGSIDFRGGRLDLQGTVVPAYTVNRILGKIPLLGWLLVGGEGEGVVAVTYRIDGPLDEPQVSVNPLSALTPGFLRGLFSGGRGGGEGEGERPTVYPPSANR